MTVSCRTSYTYLFQPRRGASPVKTAAIQMVMTMDLILAMETLVFLFLLILWMTQVLSMFSRARDQMAAMAEITEITPNT
jgi:hypothetical protein